MCKNVHKYFLARHRDSGQRCMHINVHVHTVDIYIYIHVVYTYVCVCVSTPGKRAPFTISIKQGDCLPHRSDSPTKRLLWRY